MTDIRKFAVEETSRIELRGADDVPLVGEDGQPLTVTVYGPGSKTYARAQAQRQNRLVDLLKRKGKTDRSAEEQSREQAEFLAACTQAFSGIEYDGLQGEALYRAVYSDTSVGFIA